MVVVVVLSCQVVVICQEHSAAGLAVRVSGGILVVLLVSLAVGGGVQGW